MRIRSPRDYETVNALLTRGLTEREVARQTGIPRSTVGRWRRGDARAHRRMGALRKGWIPPSRSAYSYALGLYLGDGHITTRSARSASLILSFDRRYPAIVASASDALTTLFPGAVVTQYRREPMELMLVRVSDPAVPIAFPQHGPGKKHLRPIALELWQAELTARHPEALLRGLIHSDGCRTVNRFKTRLPSGRVAQYEYPRYFFSNLSTDIRRIFTDHCDLLEIRWTQSNPRNISISQRASVARLDTFVGPKS